VSAGFLWLAAWLLLPIPGIPLLAHAAFAGLPRIGRAVLAGAVGAVLISFAMTLFALAGVAWSIGGVIVAALVLGLLLRVCVSRAPSGEAAPSGRLRVVGVLAAGVAGSAVLAALLATGVGATGSPDLVFFWGAKAQQFAALRTIDAAFLREPFLLYVNADYPPLVTNLYAFATIAAGRFPWLAATGTFPLILAALALALPGILRGATDRRRASAVSALVVAALAVIGIRAGIAGNGDMPLLFFETLSVAALLSTAVPQPARDWLAGSLLAGAATTKVEGLPFALAAAGLALFFPRGSSDSAPVRAPRLLTPTVLTLSAWFAYGASRHLFLGYSRQGQFLDLHLELLGTVFRSVAAALSSIAGGLPWLVPLLCLIAARPRLRAAALPLGTAGALVAFLLFTYLHRAEDPRLWIFWSAARVFSPVAALLGLAATGALAGRDEARAGRTRSPSPE